MVIRYFAFSWVEMNSFEMLLSPSSGPMSFLLLCIYNSAAKCQRMWFASDARSCSWKECLSAIFMRESECTDASGCEIWKWNGKFFVCSVAISSPLMTWDAEKIDLLVVTWKRVVSRKSTSFISWIVLKCDWLTYRLIGFALSMRGQARQESDNC